MSTIVKSRSTITKDDLIELMNLPINQFLNLPPIEESITTFQQAEPYPHLVIDNFITYEIAENIKKVLSNSERNEFKRQYKNQVEYNKTISTGNQVPPYLQLIISKLASSDLVSYYEKLSKISNLIPDPFYNTSYGGYYHIMQPEGVLGSHLDHSHHDTLELAHILNIVIYITPDWKEEYGGELQLFDQSGKNVVKEVIPQFNRAIFFISSPNAYHGVKKISTDAKKNRHSLYFAYYKVIKQSTTQERMVFPLLHSGSSVDPDRNLKHATYFVLPFRDLFKRQNRVHLKIRLWALANLFIPPIVVLVIRKLKSNLRTN